MPAETLTAEQLRTAFAAKGISAQELVALSGAHTVPPVRGRCCCADSTAAKDAECQQRS